MIVDDHPRGYPKLAAFINSDENFLIARKYGFLRSRVLLYRQDELSVLEKDLVALDDEDKNSRELALMSRKHDEETDKDPLYSRKVLMQKIDDKLKEYGEHPAPDHPPNASRLKHESRRARRQDPDLRRAQSAQRA